MSSEQQATTLDTQMAEHSSHRIIDGHERSSSRTSREPLGCEGFAETDDTGGSMTTTDMAITDAETKVADNFRNAEQRFFGLPKGDPDEAFRLACQIVAALAPLLLTRPREELSDGTIVAAIGGAVCDIINKAVQHEHFKNAAWDIVDAIKHYVSFIEDEGFRSDWLLPQLSRADHEALVAGANEDLAKRVRFEDWRTSIFNGEDRLDYKEFDRRVEVNPKPTGPLEPYWQIKRDCEEIITHLEANNPIVAAVEVLLKEIETEQRDGIARAGSGETHRG
jgi:hypothetical protein